MKAIGIIGGSTDLATAQYYQVINARIRQELGGWHTGEIIINSMDCGRITQYTHSGQWQEGAEYMRSKAQDLERAGADFIIAVSNTWHRMSDVWMQDITIPLLHIADPTAEAIKGLGLKTVALLGTKMTMESDYLRDYFEKHGIAVTVPDEKRQDYVSRVVFDELAQEIFLEESKEGYLEIIDHLKEKGAQGVILGCTEMPLLIAQSDRPDIPMFDTLRLHANAAAHNLQTPRKGARRLKSEHNMLPYTDYPFEYVASKLGASTDEFKLIFSFLLSYPLAAVLKRLPDDKPRIRNIFNLSVALFYLVGLFNLWGGLLVILFDAIGTYLIAAYVRGPYMPWLGFVFLMGHMSVSHIYRMIADSPSSVDVTGAQMVMVMKLSAFCWNVWDGRQKDSELNEVQRERAIRKLPDPLHYAGFVAFFPSLFAGPAFDYVDYERWINTTMFDLPPGTDPAQAPPTRKKRKIPRSATPAMFKMVTGIIWIVAFLQFSGPFGPQVLLDDHFKDSYFPTRVFYLYMMNLVARMKYYGVWTLTEGACILAGIGYKGIDPKTGKADWGRLTNVKPLGVELAQNTHAYLGNWNINTNHWLRNYIYLRVTPKGKKPGFRASMATFVTSAFWHGFAPGYYMTFVLASFVQNVAKNARRLLRPFFLTPDGSKPTKYKPYYDIFTWLVTQLAFSFVTTPFILLTVHDSTLVWARVYFYCIVGVAVCSGFLVTPGKKWLAGKVKARCTRPELKKNDSMESLHGATLGVPSEPGKEFDEMVDEIVEEVKKRKGSQSLPDVAELRKRVAVALERKTEDSKDGLNKKL